MYNPAQQPCNKKKNYDVKSYNVRIQFEFNQQSVSSAFQEWIWTFAAQIRISLK